MPEARFFTLWQCLNCMCELPHRRFCPGNINPGENERCPEIGTIVRKYFPKERAAHCNLSKAWSARHLATAWAALPRSKR